MKQQKTFSLVAFAMLQAALLLSACSSEENIPASGGIAVTDAHINISVAPFETSNGKAKTRAEGTDETKADTVLLANGMRAICTVEEDDEAEQTRAPKPIADGHYTIYACDPVTGNRITGPDKLLKGTVTGGVFQSDGGTRLFLDPGTYKFVCINDAVELTNYGLTLNAGNHGIMGTVHTPVASAGDAQIGVATETISGANWRVNFVMKHRYARLRVRIVAYTDHIDNAFGYQNFDHFGYSGLSCNPTGIVVSPLSGNSFVHSGFTLPATSTTYNKTYVRAHDFYSSYMYIMGGNDFYPNRGDISIESGNIYGKKMTINSNSGSTYYVPVLEGHSYTVTYRILPEALYLFQDGSCGAYSEKGSRTPIAVVGREKTNAKEGLAVALKNTEKAYYGVLSKIPGYVDYYKLNNKNYHSVNDADLWTDELGEQWTWESSGSSNGDIKANNKEGYGAFYLVAHYNPGVALTGDMVGKRWFFPAIGDWWAFLREFAANKTTPPTLPVAFPTAQVDAMFTNVGGIGLSSKAPSYIFSGNSASELAWGVEATSFTISTNGNKVIAGAGSMMKFWTQAVTRPFIHF
ncbi:hypothetical protein [Segatella oulorum]|uniref:hypothetical protein n=1 Tax=Segatella oulorum TaxID=28136 RepID=UPI0023F0B2D6|nr:hypothetical protein [Segatella oulorum]